MLVRAGEAEKDWCEILLADGNSHAIAARGLPRFRHVGEKYLSRQQPDRRCAFSLPCRNDLAEHLILGVAQPGDHVPAVKPRQRGLEQKARRGQPSSGHARRQLPRYLPVYL
jgi:hypothetical protein